MSEILLWREASESGDGSGHDSKTPNKPLEQTAHPAGFFRLLRYRRGWPAAHRQR
jgi:hypothetical protein